MLRIPKIHIHSPKPWLKRLPGPLKTQSGNKYSIYLLVLTNFLSFVTFLAKARQPNGWCRDLGRCDSLARMLPSEYDQKTAHPLGILRCTCNSMGDDHGTSACAAKAQRQGACPGQWACASLPFCDGHQNAVVAAPHAHIQYGRGRRSAHRYPTHSQSGVSRLAHVQDCTCFRLAIVG